MITDVIEWQSWHELWGEWILRIKITGMQYAKTPPHCGDQPSITFL